VTLKTVTSIKLAIVGAGPVGLFLAANILESNTAAVDEIDVFESSEDPRLVDNNKSFAIGFNARAVASCRRIPGFADYVIYKACAALTKTTFFSGRKKAFHVPNPMNVTQSLISTQVPRYYSIYGTIILKITRWLTLM
jgi:2-polyprenyl-6-methoxyphenol hydroxylase-like FAD-dependent oxidoreductase